MSVLPSAPAGIAVPEGAEGAVVVSIRELLLITNFQVAPGFRLNGLSHLLSVLL